MHRLWVSLCCGIIFLAISGTPPSCCVTATSTTQTDQQMPELQQNQQGLSGLEGDGRGSRIKRELDNAVDLNDLTKYPSDPLHSDDEYLNTDRAKRLRSFIGKRLSLDDMLDDGESSPYPGGYSMDKRLRSFIGKRDDMAKRVRSFIGKRPRSFIGKRARKVIGNGDDRFEVPVFMDDDDNSKDSFDNRILGKDFDSLDDQEALTLDKRPRSFIGKRDMDKLMDLQKRIRSFIGKRLDKRIRSFPGKRSDHESVAGWGENVPTLQKRLRSFIGKRSLIGNIDKRIRSFLGKRSGDDLETIWLENVPQKRLRSFIGKRSDLKDQLRLYSPLRAKRLRDFIGKRNEYPYVPNSHEKFDLRR